MLQRQTGAAACVTHPAASPGHRISTIGNILMISGGAFEPLRRRGPATQSSQDKSDEDGMRDAPRRAQRHAVPQNAVPASYQILKKK
jgi:hypothetical protein